MEAPPPGRPGVCRGSAEWRSRCPGPCHRAERRSRWCSPLCCPHHLSKKEERERGTRGSDVCNEIDRYFSDPEGNSTTSTDLLHRCQKRCRCRCTQPLASLSFPSKLQSDCGSQCPASLCPRPRQGSTPDWPVHCR